MTKITKADKKRIRINQLKALKPEAIQAAQLAEARNDAAIRLRYTSVTGNGRGVFYLQDANGMEIASFAGSLDGKNNVARDLADRVLYDEISRRCTVHTKLTDAMREISQAADNHSAMSSLDDLRRLRVKIAVHSRSMYKIGTKV